MKKTRVYTRQVYFEALVHKKYQSNLRTVPKLNVNEQASPVNQLNDEACPVLALRSQRKINGQIDLQALQTSQLVGR